MKLNHLIYTLMLGTALGTSSCSWLDLEPATAVSPSILGQGEVEQLLTGTYRSLQNDPGRDTWVLFDMRGENLINTYLSGSNDFVNNEIPSNNGTLAYDVAWLLQGHLQCQYHPFHPFQFGAQ